jgi:hypothetical protein
MNYKNSTGSDILAGRHNQRCSMHTDGFFQLSVGDNDAPGSCCYKCASCSANMDVLFLVILQQHTLDVSSRSEDLIMKQKHLLQL